MNPFEFVIAIIALAFFYKLLHAWLAQRQHASRDDDTKVVDWQRRLDAVEDRVRVLERIVTDERFDLRQQFKDLGS
jgi:hypothetical protein